MGIRLTLNSVIESIFLMAGLGIAGFVSWLFATDEVEAVRTDWNLRQAKSTLSLPGSEQIDPANDGRVVHLSVAATPEQPILSDPIFGVSAAGVLRLWRYVEMFQWKEITQRDYGNQRPGNRDHKTYEKGWFGGRNASEGFRWSQGHENPVPCVPCEILTTPVRIGAFLLDSEMVNELDGWQRVRLGEVLPPVGFRKVGETYFVTGDLSDPQIGDLRVSFSAVPASMVSVIAQQAAGPKLQKWISPAGGEAFGKVIVGEKTVSEMLEEMSLAQKEQRGNRRALSLLVLSLLLLFVFNFSGSVFSRWSLTRDLVWKLGDFLGLSLLALMLAVFLWTCSIVLGRLAGRLMLPR